MIYKNYDFTSIKLEREKRDELEALENKAVRILMNKTAAFSSGYFDNLFIHEIENKNKDSIILGLARYVIDKDSSDIMLGVSAHMGCSKMEYVKAVGSEVLRRCYDYEVFQHKGKTYVVAGILPF